MSPEPVLGALESVWSSIAEATEHLAPGEWERDTDCPGWTVRDQLSHLVGTERSLLGDAGPPPVAEGERPAHVRNEIGAMNEAWIEQRRSVPGDEVRSEFLEVTRRRVEQLSGFGEEHWAKIGWSPIGQVPYRDFMGTRVMDCWAHEQDIRRAVGRPGGRDGAGERIALDRCESAIPFVVGKRVAPPEGTSVAIDVSGPFARRIQVAVVDGRARAVPPEGTPTATIAMDPETFVRRCFGRSDAGEVLASGAVSLSGDEELGRAVVAALDFMI